MHAKFFKIRNYEMINKFHTLTDIPMCLCTKYKFLHNSRMGGIIFDSLTTLKKYGDDFLSDLKIKFLIIIVSCMLC